MSDRSSETTENFTPDFIRERILAAPARAEVLRWGLREYGEILTLQETLRSRRQADEMPDTWLVGEHPAVIVATLVTVASAGARLIRSETGSRSSR